jgi:hypothetical protein
VFLTDGDASATADACERAQRRISIVAAVLADVLLDLRRVAATADRVEGGWVRLGVDGSDQAGRWCRDGQARDGEERREDSAGVHGRVS